MKDEIRQEVDFLDQDYDTLLFSAVEQISAARNALAVNINTTVISTYWNLGKLLYERKLAGGYGSNVINRLSVDLKAKFPDMGVSPRNLWNMKLFYERYFDSDKKLLQAVAVLSWGHNLLLINKRLSDEASYFYAVEASKNHWSRELLLNAIKMDVFSTRGSDVKDNNFSLTLPKDQADVANKVFKDSYNLGFLGLTHPVAELELERRLIEKIKLFMLELGRGFAFIGNQYRLEYNGKEYYVDMLFSNRKLNCLVAVDLKIGEFKSEYVGKMNMYLSLLDKLEKEERENQSIGVILCAEKDHLDVELALQDVNKPIAVSDYELIFPKKALQEMVMSEMKLIQS